jgi:putative FmdB family regulatory protein
MPIYEYICHKCGKEFEVLQKFSDKPLKKCEECGGAVEKKISSSSFHLKGSGWYKDDYSSSSADTKKDKKDTKNNPGCSSCPNC